MRERRGWDFAAVDGVEAGGADGRDRMARKQWTGKPPIAADMHPVARLCIAAFEQHGAEPMYMRKCRSGGKARGKSPEPARTELYVQVFVSLADFKRTLTFHSLPPKDVQNPRRKYPKCRSTDLTA